MHTKCCRFTLDCLILETWHVRDWQSATGLCSRCVTVHTRLRHLTTFFERYAVGYPRIRQLPRKLNEACGLYGLCSTAHRRRRHFTSDFFLPRTGPPRDCQPVSKMSGLCSIVHTRRCRFTLDSLGLETWHVRDWQRTTEMNKDCDCSDPYATVIGRFRPFTRNCCVTGIRRPRVQLSVKK